MENSILLSASYGKLLIKDKNVSYFHSNHLRVKFALRRNKFYNVKDA